MGNELLLLVGYALNVALITYLFRKGWHWVCFVIITNMLLISTFAMKQITIFGFDTNATNLCYAAVFYGMSVIATKENFRTTMKAVHAIFAAMLLFLVSSNIILLFTPADGNIYVDTLLHTLYGAKPQIIAASFLAFYISNSINIFFITRDKGSLLKNKLTGNIVGQFADSAIFFPIAFWGALDWHIIVLATAGGFFVKSLLNLADTFAYHKFIVSKL